MPRSKRTAAVYIERHDTEMRLILRDLVEHAEKVNAWWADARSAARESPERAMATLADAEIHLNHHIRIELRDSLRRIRAAMDLLDAELPDANNDGKRAIVGSGEIPEH